MGDTANCPGRAAAVGIASNSARYLADPTWWWGRRFTSWLLGRLVSVARLGDAADRTGRPATLGIAPDPADRVA
jgi:hypothetical protein